MLGVNRKRGRGNTCVEREVGEVEEVYTGIQWGLLLIVELESFRLRLNNDLIQIQRKVCKRKRGR